MSKKEEKAIEYAESEIGLDYIGAVAVEKAYKEGWDYALLNQWISVKERLPELNERVLVIQHLITRMSVCIMKRIPHDTSNPNNKEWHWSLTNYKEDIIAWMPIPSFDEILKENKELKD